MIVYFISVILFVMTFNINQYDYPVKGSFKGHSAQGMAICDDYAFLLNDSGLCRIYDLKMKKVLCDFPLKSANPRNHANSASFGIEYSDSNSQYPALYISECRIPSRCFVEDVILGNSRLIQTLRFEKKGKSALVYTWIVDAISRKLYGLTSQKNQNGGTYILIRRFRLPSLSEGDIVFTEKDIEEEFDISIPNLLQGGAIRDNILYLPMGLHGKGDTEMSERAIVLIDLRQQKVIDKIVLNDLTKNEPEDVDFYGGELLMYCGQQGGLWKIKQVKNIMNRDSILN